MTVVLVVLTILAFLLMDFIGGALLRRGMRAARPPRVMRPPEPPFGVFLDEGHAWLRLADDGTLRVGVDDFLAEAMERGAPRRLAQARHESSRTAACRSTVRSPA